MRKHDFIHRMVEVTKRNKREEVTRQAYGSYKQSSHYSLYDVYDNPSIYKDRAFKKIMNEMYNYDGYDLKVISYNPTMFTCGYMIELQDETYFVRHTASYTDCIKII